LSDTQHVVVMVLKLNQLLACPKLLTTLHQNVGIDGFASFTGVGGCQVVTQPEKDHAPFPETNLLKIFRWCFIPISTVRK